MKGRIMAALIMMAVPAIGVFLGVMLAAGDAPWYVYVVIGMPLVAASTVIIWAFFETARDGAL